MYVNLQACVIGVPEVPALGCIVGNKSSDADNKDEVRDCQSATKDGEDEMNTRISHQYPYHQHSRVGDVWN